MNQLSQEVIAQLAGHQNMEQILEIFSQKIIGNLMFSQDKVSDANLRTVDLSLDVLSQYITSTIACRSLSQIPVIKEIATTHINQFRILQAPKQAKQLGQFFRVLTNLWLTEDYITHFHDYLNQLNPMMEKVFSQSTDQLKQNPRARDSIIQILYILRGVIRGL